MCVFFSFPKPSTQTRPCFRPAVSSPLVGGVLFSLSDRELREISSQIMPVFFTAACESEPRENEIREYKTHL